jgi:hypothetical protein
MPSGPWVGARAPAPPESYVLLAKCRSILDIGRGGASGVMGLSKVA